MLWQRLAVFRLANEPLAQPGANRQLHLPELA
jgi:hypothetical protein